MIYEHFIVASDDDCELWATVVAGFDNDKNFVVQFEEQLYTYPHTKWVERDTAILDRPNTETLSRRLRVPITSLPEAISDRFFDDYPSYSADDVKSFFQEILDFILSKGAHFRINREEFTKRY